MKHVSYSDMNARYEVTYTFQFARGQHQMCTLLKWSVRAGVGVFVVSVDSYAIQ